MCTVNIVCIVLSTDNVPSVVSIVYYDCYKLCVGYHGIVKYSLNFMGTNQTADYVHYNYTPPSGVGEYIASSQSENFFDPV